MEKAATRTAEEQTALANKAMEDAETSATTSPASPGVCLLLIEPLTPSDYVENFAEGDIPECYRRSCCTDPNAFKGSWQLLLGGRSDSVEELLGALGISLLKRKVMANYASVTDIQILSSSSSSSSDSSSSSGGEGSSSQIAAAVAATPTFELTTHLPLKNTKQGTFCFDGSCTEVQDSDTGNWACRCVWLRGRALQRRWGPLGVMFDSRCVFAADPLEGSKLEGPVMLFVWTFHPKGKAPIKCMRWLRKI